MLWVEFFVVSFFFQWTIAQYIPKILETRDASSECANQIDAYIAGLQNGQAWAWNLFDASPKLPYGILTGNIVEFGNYDECLRVKYYNSETETILGKYCMMAYLLILPVNLTMDEPAQPMNQESRKQFELFLKSTGLPMQPEDSYRTITQSICIPDACTPTEFLNSLEISSLPIMPLADICETIDDINEFTGSDLAFVIFIGIMLVLVIACTIYDEITKTRNASVNPLFVSFSITRNFKQIMKDSKSIDRIACLDGLRVFSMIWVILGHRYAMAEAMPYVNSDSVAQWRTQTYSQYAQGAPLAVDTFLFLTGVLMATSMMRSQSKPNAKFNILMFYIHRYLRITPAMAMVFFLHVSVFNNLGNGPYWSLLADYFTENCANGWASFFFYYQNYLDSTEMCLTHTWYLSMDMQIFVLSPVLLLPLAKFRKYRKHMITIVIPVLITLSIVCPFVITYVYKTQMFSTEYDIYYYYPTHTRLSAWLVGVYAGAIIYTYKDAKLNIDPLINIIMWGVVLIGMAACVICGNDVAYNYNRLSTSFYLSLHKPAWCFGLAWIVFACMKRRGGIVNYILSASLFEKLSKITYSIYLVHASCLLYSAGRIRYPTNFNDYDLFHAVLGDVLVATIAGLVWCLLFESPLIVIEKIIFGRSGKSSKEQKAGFVNEVAEVKTEN